MPNGQFNFKYAMNIVLIIFFILHMALPVKIPNSKELHVRV